MWNNSTSEVMKKYILATTNCLSTSGAALKFLRGTPEWEQ